METRPPIEVQQRQVLEPCEQIVCQAVGTQIGGGFVTNPLRFTLSNPLKVGDVVLLREFVINGLTVPNGSTVPTELGFYLNVPEVYNPRAKGAPNNCPYAIPLPVYDNVGTRFGRQIARTPYENQWLWTKTQSDSITIDLRQQDGSTPAQVTGYIFVFDVYKVRSIKK